MDDEHMQQKRKDDELTRRLEAYAQARLSPDVSATIRMRARAMAAAHRHAALAQADADRAAAVAADAALTPFGRTRRSTWRRPMTALLAAGLTLGIGVSSVAAAQPGGPLYNARVWAESLTLPDEANARAQAELARLQSRLAEAAAAAAAGDTNAANAALDAYAGIVNEAAEDAGNDVSAAATLETGVRSNIDVLTVLVDRVPTEAARNAIQRAIDRSDSALDKMHGNPHGTPPGLDPERTPKPDPTNRPDRTANPNRPTDKPDKTAKPRPTARADQTPRGGRPSLPAGLPGRGSQNGGQGN
jgi:Domain of unknown function (DUF5667)